MFSGRSFPKTNMETGRVRHLVFSSGLHMHILLHIHHTACTHLHIHLHTPTHTYKLTYTHTYTYTYTHIPTHTYIYTYTDTHTYVYTYTHTYTHTYICTHTYIHTHTLTHTPIHTHIVVYLLKMLLVSAFSLKWEKKVNLLKELWPGIWVGEVVIHWALPRWSKKNYASHFWALDRGHEALGKCRLLIPSVHLLQFLESGYKGRFNISNSVSEWLAGMSQQEQNCFWANCLCYLVFRWSGLGLGQLGWI